MIKKIYFKSIHTAEENNIIYWMNNHLNSEERGLALNYGFVAESIKNWLLNNLKTLNNDSLWSIVSSNHQKSPEDAVYRDYHGIICHSHIDDPFWKEAPTHILQSLNNNFSGKDIWSLLIWKWLMWQINKANIEDILAAMIESEANINLYIRNKSEALPMQIVMKRLSQQPQFIGIQPEQYIEELLSLS